MGAGDMAKVVGLHEVGGVFRLRVMIPLDLQGAYQGRTKLVKTIGRMERREAVLLAHKMRTDFLLGFEEMRKSLNPEPLNIVTPELGQLLAERVHARVLKLDAALRDSPELLDALVDVVEAASNPSPLLIPLDQSQHLPAKEAPKVPRDALTGLSDEQAKQLEGLNQGLFKEASKASARRNLAKVLPLIQQEAKQLGLSFDAATPGAREALKAALDTYRDAIAKASMRDLGEDVPTPEAPEKPKPSSHLSLREVYNRWKASKATRSDDSNQACLRALVLFEKQEPEASDDITRIDRQMGDAFRAWLQQQDTTTKTARDRFNWIKSLLKYAFRDLHAINRQPWEGLEIKFKTASRRRVWALDELQRLLSQPLFTRYELPSAWNAGADAAYWIPLLGLYHGARLGELCQLMAADITTRDGVPVILIHEEGEDQAVKTEAGIRHVPIHSELIRLGFMDYVEKTHKASPNGPLWPALKKRKGKPSGYFSRWFNEMRRLPPLSLGERPDFHCFRHSARTAMTEAGITESIQDRITGHEVSGSTGAKVYAHPVKILRTAVESITYAIPALARCYPTKDA